MQSENTNNRGGGPAKARLIAAEVSTGPVRGRSPRRFTCLSVLAAPVLYATPKTSVHDAALRASPRLSKQADDLLNGDERDVGRDPAVQDGLFIREVGEQPVRFACARLDLA